MKIIKKKLQKILDKQFQIGIIGLGYVGLPLMWTFHKTGMSVTGFDIDDSKIDSFERGIPYIKHLGKNMMQILSKSSRANATNDFSLLSMVDAIILCVPTPLNKFREPDMSYIINTTETVSKYLKKGQLVVLESTTWPGTTEEIMIPILEKKSKLKSGIDFFVAYSPEREDPGNINFNTSQIPKVIGAHGKEALSLAEAMYNTSIVKTVLVSDCKTAEASKLTENIFRSVNIALVNELKMVYEAMGIDVHEVIDAAATKPFGFMKFSPGPGLGGHCIPIDPFYLTWKAREFNMNTKFIELAGEVNVKMPNYVIDRVAHALNTHKKSINGSKILVIGLAYKPDVDDMRESPTFKIFDLLKAQGAKIKYYDPFIPEINFTREHKEWAGTKSIKWDSKIISNFDLVLISTNHSNINYNELAEWSKCIVDSRNAMKGIKSLVKNHIINA